MSKISKYLEERAKWKKFGKPLRSAEEIQEIFSICESCPMFKRSGPDTGECGECGCHIKREGNFLNKPAWGTTRCPLPEPKWVESKEKYAREISLSKSDLLEAEEDNKIEVKVLENNNPKKGGCGCGK
jgi:hypothetical protein